MTRLLRSSLVVTFLIPGMLLAQAAAPPSAPEPGAPPAGPPGPGGMSRPPMEERFFHGMALMALDEKAGLLVEAGKPEAAIAELRRVYTYDLPKDHPVYEVRVRLVGKLARLLATSGQKDEAIKTVTDLLADVAKGTPSEAAAWFEAGKSYRQLGMTDDALKAFDRAIALSDELSKQSMEHGPPAGGPKGRRPGGPDDRPMVPAPGPPR